MAALGQGAKAVPMDGFHYDDAVLIARGARDRKGAPDTFDVHGFLHLLRRLRVEDEVAIPLFDRDLEISRAGADIVTVADRLLVVEGNYLLLNEAPWPEAAPLFDLTVWIDVPEDPNLTAACRPAGRITARPLPKRGPGSTAMTCRTFAG